ncbi:hypothetical protein FA10DRAFT_270031 [Acaromyces ingoldii]|uniref:Uncharacterized protein n=1 Tax=Acaromyces ingoldii TaxID=215250 RepID=A0A316YBN2_9BASI|nr:hypothetical protein FA10DRAFT_270031 [Acaromyces ingoldii]PWN86661.1 hypothetical protein FA10DRAFT_270031 [Acaromyces ingoldii]
MNHNNGYIKRDLFEFKQPGREFGAGNGDRRYLFTLHGSFVDLPEVAVPKDVLIRYVWKVQ